MERRDFIKISAITGAAAALDGCGQPDVQLIRFIPEEELTPGVATWKPSICTLCPAGCGTLVKVMEGDAEVVRNGKLGVMKRGLAKKIEGNPRHPISQGKLCPRGQAMPQVTYHPDRIKHPLRRTGPRGSGQFQEMTWDEAIEELVTKLRELQAAKQQASLAFLTKPLRGQRRELVERFLSTYGAPPPVMFELFDESVLRRANALSFGRPQLPTFDLANSNYVISFGADFLGTWNSPVAQSIAYGQMRQGRPAQRGKFVMIESRLSQTGSNADEWIPSRPGTEGILALGLAHVIFRDKLRPASAAGHAGSLIAGWSRGLPDYSPEAVEAKIGVAGSRITRLAHEMATHAPAVALTGGAALAHTNALATALAVNALNALLGSVLKPGGVYFTFQRTPGRESVLANPEPRGSYGSLLNALGIPEADARRPIQALLLYDANPLFATPAGTPVQEAIKEIPFLASFGSFLDETSVFADLMLPDHSPLESWLDDNPESGTPHAVSSLAPPAVRPLHNTRAMPDVLLDIAHRMGGRLEAALPSKSYDAMLRASFVGFLTGAGAKPAMDPEEFWKEVQAQGGSWSESELAFHGRGGFDHAPVQAVEPQFDAPPEDYPFHLLPYAPQTLYDGSLAHLPWLQEAPDPLSTAMWNSWVEINTKTAQRLGIKQGDQVEVASQHGKLRAPALVTPGIAPDVVAMPVGQGHTNFTRYASGRGANPISILAPMVVPETGSLAWAATRVKITKVGEGKLTLFGAELREHPHEHR
jgi:anaerobic selenocysteine-containing dehydrogenase